MSGGWLWIVVVFVLGVLEILLFGWIFLGMVIVMGLMGIVILLGLWIVGLLLMLVVIVVLLGLCWLVLCCIFGSSWGDVWVWMCDINDYK